MVIRGSNIDWFYVIISYSHFDAIDFIENKVKLHGKWQIYHTMSALIIHKQLKSLHINTES